MPNSAHHDTISHRRWVLVAHQAGARFFESKHKNHVELIEQIDYPNGRLKHSELKSDKQGRGFDSMGGQRHHLGSMTDAPEHEATVFAQQLADKLDLGRKENHFNEVVLIADPYFLGKLRDVLSSELSKIVVGSHSKDYAHTPMNELKERILALL